MEAITKRLDELNAKVDKLLQMGARLAAVEDNLGTCRKNIKVLNGNVQKLENEVKTLSTKNTELENALTAMTLNNEATTKRIQAAEKTSDDIIEATQRLRNLRVDLLPEVPGESLRATVSKLFAIVGCNLDDRTQCYRLKMGRSNGTVIINFSTEAEKEIFFFNYVKVARNILAAKFIENPKHKEARVYVSHDLCQTQYQVWKELSKVREGVIKSQRIHRGFVYIRTAEDKPPQRILSLDMLKEVVNKS